MKKIIQIAIAGLTLSLVFAAENRAQQVINETIQEIESEEKSFSVVQIVGGLEHPWAVNWLSDERMVITERPGRMLLVTNGEITSLGGLPEIDTDEDQKTAPQGGNQGGLLDVVAHPDHEDNEWI